MHRSKQVNESDYACKFTHVPSPSKRSLCTVFIGGVFSSRRAAVFDSSAFLMSALMESILLVISAIFALPADVLLDEQ